MSLIRAIVETYKIAASATFQRKLLYVKGGNAIPGILLSEFVKVTKIVF